jgi:transposase InsO family protein
VNVGDHLYPPPRRLLLPRRRAGRVAFFRRCVGWHLSRDIDTRLTLAALERGLTERRPAAGLIHHSDRGVRVRARANEYAGGEYVARLESAGALPSMSAKGTPKTLKTEEVYLQEYQNFAEARSNLGPFIEAVYNRKRLHSALGYLPPAEFESAFRENNDKSARLA